MARSADTARTRLQAAALELFGAHGYDRVTASQIAARAGVTERTFFRHFPDKREVLFDGEALVRATLTEAIEASPERLGPLAVLRRAFEVFAPVLEERLSYARPRQALIDSTPALHERELAKVEALCGALARALEGRGVPRLRATLAAQAAMAAFVQASEAWTAEPAGGLGARVATAFDELALLLDEAGGAEG